MSDEAKLVLIFVCGWVLLRGCPMDKQLDDLTKRVEAIEAKQKAGP